MLDPDLVDSLVQLCNSMLEEVKKEKPKTKMIKRKKVSKLEFFM